MTTGIVSAVGRSSAQVGIADKGVNFIQTKYNQTSSRVTLTSTSTSLN